MKYKFKHIVEYSLLRAVAGLVRALPLHAALALGWLAAATARLARLDNAERTCSRIRQAFGDTYTDREIKRFAWIAWRNLFFTGVEALRFSKLTAKAIRKQPMARLESRLKQVLDGCDAGFILATPHMGNWEMAGIAADLLDIPLFVIVRKQKNPLMNNFINEMRRTFSLEVLYRESRMWNGVATRLKNGKVLAILPDIQSKAKGITVDYLNGKAVIAPGAAHFAQLAGCPIYPIVVRRIGWSRHDAVLLEPIRPDAAANKREDQQRIMQEIMTAFTAEISKTPEQYFWHNKRWVLNKEPAPPPA